MTRNGYHLPDKTRPSPAKAPRHTVEVAVKYGMKDAPGEALLKQIPLLGIPGAREIRVTKLYELAGRLTANQLNQISRDLLSDPITQEYRVEKSAPSPAFLMGPHWRAEVWLKPTVNDPVGASVRAAVADLGLPEPTEVRTGEAFLISGRVNRAQAEKILSRLLANPVIHQTKLAQI